MIPALFWVLIATSQVLAVHELCGKFETFYTVDYAWNNNAWHGDGSGSTCTYVSEDPDSQSNAFHVLWQWAGDPVVRAFPNIGLRTKALPVQIRDLRSLNISAAWSMSPSSLVDGSSADSTSILDTDALDANGVEANVCLDVFADGDEARSQEFGEQAHEVMIWFMAVGSGAKPIGSSRPLHPPVVTIVQDTEFTLYKGTNSNGQSVLSWTANRTLTNFDIDVAPLFGFLASEGFLPEDIYLGTVQFGTEQFAATSQIEFDVTSFDASIRTVQTESGSVNATNSQAGNATTTDSSGMPVATQLQSSARATSTGRLLFGLTVLISVWLAGPS